MISKTASPTPPTLASAPNSTTTTTTAAGGNNVTSQERTQEPSTSSVKALIAGGVGGVCVVLAGHPFDLIKVRLQTSPTKQGVFQAVRQAIRKDGFLGLYRGMAVPVLVATPIFALMFWGYDIGKKLIATCRPTEVGPDAPFMISEYVTAGGFSALPTTLVVVPAERVKCMLQVHKHYRGPLDAARHVLKSHGLRGFAVGTTGTLVRDVPGSMVFFGVYEAALRAFGKGNEGSGHFNSLAVLTAGGLAGVADIPISHPGDVLKSRHQAAPLGTYAGFTDVYRRLVSQDGHAALFRGFGPAIAKAFPANAACFLGVESTHKVLDKLW